MLKKLGEHAYYMSHDHSTDRPALGLIVGDRCSLIVDAGNSAAHAGEFLEGVAALNAPEPRYLVVTHWHWDHTFGIDRMNLTTIAHTLTDEKLRWMGTLRWDDESLEARVQEGTEIKFCADNIKKEHPDRTTIHIRSVDITYDGSLTVDLGGVTCRIFHLGGEHSADSTVIYSPEAKVLFLGDGLCQEMSTGEWSYDLTDVKERFDKIKDLPCDWYVNSHWPPQNSADFADWCERMIEAGELTGELTDFDKAEEAYAKGTGKEPDPDAKFMLESYVWGNIKRMKAGACR